MKKITRDISLTLILKLILLTTLWFVCFRHPVKPQPINHWLNTSLPTSGEIT